MEINIIFQRLLGEQMILKTTQSKPIVNAIKNRNPVSFYYSGPRKPKKNSVKAGKRVRAEIVAMGLSKRGSLIVRAYIQPPSVSKKGYDKTNWRTFMVSRMSRIEVLNNETFDIQRPQYQQGDDKSMTVTYVTSDWTNKPPKVKKEVPLKTEPQTTTSVKNVPIKKEPIKKEVPPKVNSLDLPQVKPVSKPKRPEEIVPQVEPEEPKTTELPQPKPIEKPENLNPEDSDEVKNSPISNELHEILKRFKSLI